LGDNFQIHEIFRTDNFLNEDLNEVEVGNMPPLALMFQAGYLTVASKEFASGAARYYLRFPNFEVESAVYGLTLNFFGQNTFRLTQLRQKAKAMVASMVALDSAGLETAFGDILASLPYNTHTPYEGHYQALFIMTLASIGLRYEAESRAGDGTYDLQLQTESGAHYIIELKCESYKAPKTNKDLPKDKFKENMKKAAVSALAQIEEKKYYRKFRGEGTDIYKMALVVGGYFDVLVVFEKAQNWGLVRGADGCLKVVRE
jgi:hypothetical protein